MRVPVIAFAIETGTASGLRITLVVESLFSVIGSSSWSLIFYISCSRSSGAMDEDVREVLGSGPKYCLIVTPTLAAHTRPWCSGCPMATVSTFGRPWATKEPCEAYSSNEFCKEHIYWFTQSHNKHK